MTNQELQNIVGSVLSALEQNSVAIEGLTPISTLNDTDLFEVSGGRRITFGALKDLITSMSDDDIDSLKSLIRKQELKSVEIIISGNSATLKITSFGKSISCTIPLATEDDCGLMSAIDKHHLDSAYLMAKTANEFLVDVRETADNAKRIVDQNQGKIEELEQRVNEVEAPGDELRDYADETAINATNHLQSKLNIYPFDGVAPTVSSISADNYGIIWVSGVKQFYKQGSKVYTGNDGNPLTNRIYSYDGMLYIIVNGDLTPFVSKAELTQIIASTRSELEQEIEELHEEVNEYVDDVAEGAVRDVQSKVGIYQFDGIAPTVSAIAQGNEGVIWVTEAKAFYQKGSKVYQGADGNPATDRLYRLEGRLYNIVEGELVKLVREDEVDEKLSDVYERFNETDDSLVLLNTRVTNNTNEIATLDQTVNVEHAQLIGEERQAVTNLSSQLTSTAAAIRSEIEELHEEVNEYVDNVCNGVEERTAEMHGIRPFDGIQGSESSMPADGKIYFVNGVKRFLSKDPETGQIKAHYEPTTGYPNKNYLYRNGGVLYKVEQSGLSSNLVAFATTEGVNEVARNLSVAKQEIGIKPFDAIWSNYPDNYNIHNIQSVMAVINNLPTNGRIYWVDGQGFYKDRVRVYNEIGTSMEDYVFRCGNEFYQVKYKADYPYLSKITDGPKELFAQLWENYFTVWTPFGGVSTYSGAYPHFSMKLGGVDRDADGKLVFKLFGFELTYEEALEVMQQPDPACFNSIYSISQYLAQFNGNAGVRPLAIPRQPLQSFAGNFSSTFSQAGMRSIILPQMTLSAIAQAYCLAEAIMVYTISNTNCLKICTQLKELYLIELPQTLPLQYCPDLSIECVERLIELGKIWKENGSAMPHSITIHPDVYNSLSNETFLLAAVSNVSIVCGDPDE